MTCRKPSRSACAPPTRGNAPCAPAPDSFDSLQAIIDHYRAEYGGRVAKEAAFFGDKSQTIRDAVRRAARSELADGSVHDHQRRPGRRVMHRCAAALEGHEEIFVDPPNFAAVFASVERILKRVDGAGEMIIYDIAERIGWRLGLEPDAVYLHRGTRDGAWLLKPDLRSATVAAADLAPELAQLRPAHVENLLCIYKAALASLKSRGLL